MQFRYKPVLLATTIDELLFRLEFHACSAYTVLDEQQISFPIPLEDLGLLVNPDHVPKKKIIYTVFMALSSKLNLKTEVA